MKPAGASRAFLACAALCILAAAGSAAGAESPAAAVPTAAVTVRSGNHPGLGRLVIETAIPTAYTLDQDGDHAVLRLTGDVSLGTLPPLPRNVIAMKAEGAVLDLRLQHGAQVRPWGTNGRIVLDIVDGAAASPAVRPIKVLPETRPHPPPAMALSPELGGRAAATAARAAEAVHAEPLPPPNPAQPAAGSAEPPQSPEIPPPDVPVMEATQLPPGRDVLPEIEGPVALRARRIRLPKEMDGTAFLVPFDAATGAAAFDGGNSTYIVFDERRPVDMAGLSADPVFAAASVRLLPTGTLLQIPHPPTQWIALTQLPQGWRIAALKNTPKLEAVAASVVDGRLNLTAEQSGDVVNMADPNTGATLLVGTQHRPGQGTVLTRQSAEFILRPTSQGVVIEALADTIVLRQTPTGFSLSSGPAGLALSPATSATAMLMDAAHLTRLLDLPVLAPDALLRLAIQQLDEAAATPPLARGPAHLAAAQSFMSLGMAAEAQSLLHMASDQDPKEAASAVTGALSAIAALLAGRPDESAALMDPRLDGTDEIAMWRAVRQAMQDEGSPRAAAVFASTAPLVFQYPRPIQEHILPLIAETMVEGGELPAATRVLAQRKDDPKLAYARALLRQAEGDSGQALAMLDALANGRDQFDRARAAIRAVELRLSTNELTKVQAADALDKLLYAWRGDARELALRERIAELRGQTGEWRVALSTLRQAETDFPEQAAPVHQRLRDMFAGMVADKSILQMPPIDFVATVEENADLMQGIHDDEAVEQPLADRLLALDLPGRARPVLEKLIKQAKSGVTRARFGASLAALDAREGDDAGALKVLDASEGADLPPDLTEQRLLVRAGSIAHQGDPAAAAAMLAPMRTARVLEARAQILETASDWAGAEKAWADCVSATLPEDGTLDGAQARTVLRFATATARAGDDAALAALRDTYGPRIGAGPLADMFRLLTAAPIQSAADIGRSKREVSLATSLPTDLKALQPGATAR